MIFLAWLLILSRPMLAFGTEQRGYSSQGSSTNSSNSSGSGYSYGGTNSSSGQNVAPSSSAAAEEAPAEITGGSFRSARYEVEKPASLGSNTSPHGPKDRPAVAGQSKRVSTSEQSAEPVPGPLSLADAWDNYQTVLGIYLAQNGAGGFWTPADPETGKTLRLKLLRVEKDSFSETTPGRYTARVLFQSKTGKTIREAKITADLSGPAWQVSQAELKSATGRP